MLAGDVSKWGLKEGDEVLCVWANSILLSFQKGKIYKIAKSKYKRLTVIDENGNGRNGTIGHLYKLIPVNNLTRILYDV